MASDPADTAWYVRPEKAGRWHLSLCGAHGEAVREHRFVPCPDPPAALGDPERCVVCAMPETLREVQRCTCEAAPARCPVHLRG
jgi:hypothetical protein